MYAFFLLVLLFISRSRNNMNIKILVFQIIGQAAVGSAGPVPTPVGCYACLSDCSLVNSLYSDMIR